MLTVQIKFALFVCAFLVGAVSFSAPIFAEDSLILTENQSLGLANVFESQGQNESAKKIYASLFNSSDYNLRTEAVFRLANLAMREKDYNKAIKYYLHILKYYPDSVFARLELARAYFMNADYSLAEQQFLFVRSVKGLPEEIAYNIDIFLSAIRRQKNWSVNTYFSLVPDSNLNYASGDKEECLIAFGGVFCRPLEQKEKGLGIKYGLNGNHYLRFTRNFGLQTSIDFSALDYSTSRYDDYDVVMAIGPRYIFNKGEISLQPLAGVRWYQGNLYTNQYGIRLSSSFQLGNSWFFNAGTSYRNLSYKNDLLDDFLAADVINLYVQPRYYINNKSFLLFGLNYEYSYAKVKAYGYSALGLFLGYYNEWNFGFSSFIRADITNVNALEAKYFINQDYIPEAIVKKDWIGNIYVRITNRFLEWKNFYPAISYSYTKRFSNVWSQEFDKHKIELEIGYRF